MSLKALCRGLLAVADLAALAGGAFAQITVNRYFYTEVAKTVASTSSRAALATTRSRGASGAEIAQAHAAGLRPERRDRRLRLRGRDQPLQLQARPARRVLPEAEGDAEAGDNFKIGVGDDDLRRLHLQGRPEDHGLGRELRQQERVRGPPGLHQRTGNSTTWWPSASRPTSRLARRPQQPASRRRDRLRATSTAASSSASSTPSASSTWTRSPPTAPGSASASSRPPTWTSWRASTATVSRGRSSSSARAT